jgi:uncharacterized protein
MNKTAKVIALFEVTTSKNRCSKMGEIIARAAKLSRWRRCHCLNQPERRTPASMHRLKRAFGSRSGPYQLRDQRRKELYANRSEAFAFLIGTAVYDRLEKMRPVQDVATEIRTIVIENV